MLKRIYRYRDVLRFLVVKDIKSTYRNSILGYFWLILSPLCMMLVFYAVFSIVVKIQVKHYPLFLLSALLPWQFLTNSLSRSTSSLIEYAPVLKASSFPREYIPFSAVLVYFIQLLLSLPLLFLFSIFYHVRVFPWILPVPLILQFILVTGLSFFFSSFNVFYRDAGVILNFLLLLWFYATPVFYPLSYVPPSFLRLYCLNPMVYVVSAYRTAFLGNPVPPPFSLLYATGMSIFLFMVGYLFFKHKEQGMVKWL